MRLLHNIVMVLIMALVMVLSLSGCASLPAGQRAASDPWEAMNRPLFRVNVGADSVITRPLAKGYRAIMPGPVRTGVSNFARNLTTPRSAINNFLQGKPANGFSEIARFLFNSTLGLAGIFDVATAGGMEEYREDFGQTAAVWGVPDGPYVMLPILGPQTLRDALLIPLDILADPMYYYDDRSVRNWLYVLRLIDLRYRLLSADKFLDDSPDPYVTLRESYLQNRQYEIYDGDPPLDDDFLDEFLEEEY